MWTSAMSPFHRWWNRNLDSSGNAFTKLPYSADPLSPSWMILPMSQHPKCLPSWKFFPFWSTLSSPKPNRKAVPSPITLACASPALRLAGSLPPSLSLGQTLSSFSSCSSSLGPVTSPLAWFEMIWVPSALEPAPVNPFRQASNPGHGIHPSAVCSCSPHPQRTNASWSSSRGA